MFYNDTLGKYISAQMIAKRKERMEKKISGIVILARLLALGHKIATTVIS